MSAITNVRVGPSERPGRKLHRGTGAFNANDATGDLAVPNGSIIGFRATAVGTPTPVSFSVTNTPNNSGMIAPVRAGGSYLITIARSATTDSGLKFQFEVEYDSQ